MNPQERIPSILQKAAQKTLEFDLRDELLSCTPDTVLLGDGAVLDSMGFVNFIVAVEDSIESEFGIAIDLSEEISSSMPGSDSTLRMGDLATLLSDLVRKRRGG